jgi:hypothetical protein
MATRTAESGRGSRHAINTETILDIVQRLGLVDILTARLRQRIEDVDVDELFDELGKYVRRNPEVLVVALAAITVSAGLVVYLNGRRDVMDWDEEDEEFEVEEPRPRPAPAPRVAANRATAPRARRSANS